MSVAQMTGNPASYTLEQALAAATETRCLAISAGATRETASVFGAQFGCASAMIVADRNTFGAAGRQVAASFQAAGHAMVDQHIFDAPDLYAEMRFVEELETALRPHGAIPVAAGSGTINDLVKLASHRAGRPYMCVATAASMDGYTAFGASITHEGQKQTFQCPAPRAVVADVDVIGAAPGLMNSWGYADLVAKIPAGADWILADALGVEPLDAQAWAIVQGRLRDMVADAAGIPARRPEAIARLVEGLMLGGFAMQSNRSSRPASGAEHQFSHLWDMQHHTHQGAAPSHGFKVGIGTLAVTALYEELLDLPLDRLDVESCCAAWPSEDAWMAFARRTLGDGEVAAAGIKELRAKHIGVEALRSQLETLRATWPVLRTKLRAQLLPPPVLRGMLCAANAPVDPGQIGIGRERLRASYWQAFCIRRRFTVLDLAVRAGVLDQCLDRIFGPGGLWPLDANESKETSEKP